MSLRLVLAAAATLTLASPVFAQDANPAPVAPAPAANAEAEFEAVAEAFEAKMEAMQAEMTAAVATAGADTAKRDADLDAIQAKYQPDADAFAAQLDAFLTSQMSAMPEEQRAQMTQMGPMIMVKVKGAPAEVRAKVIAAPAAPAAAQ